MDYKAAIAKLQTLEGGPELAAVIEARTSELEQKNYTAIGEVRTSTGKLRSVEAALLAVGKALGLEGDLEALLAGLEEKARTITTELGQTKTKSTEFEQRATQAEGKLSTLEKQSKFAQAAAKAGANLTVLLHLFGSKEDLELKVTDDGVMVGDKPLKEYVEADQELKAYLPALFPGDAGKQPEKQPEKQPDQKQPAQQLPTGTPNAGNSNKTAAQIVERATGRKQDLSWLNKK